MDNNIDNDNVNNNTNKDKEYNCSHDCNCNYNNSNNNIEVDTKKIKKLLKETNTNMVYALNDYNMDKGSLDIYLYFNPDKITMKELIDNLYNCLKLEYIEDFNSKTFSKETQLKEFINQQLNKDVLEKEYQNSNIFKRIYNYIFIEDHLWIDLLVAIFLTTGLISIFYVVYYLIEYLSN
jgi:hypothetical protein